MKSIVIAALLAATGIVDSVREVPLAGTELLVELDDGREITVMQTGMQVFQPGERVFLLPDGNGGRVEHADDPPL